MMMMMMILYVVTVCLLKGGSDYPSHEINRNKSEQACPAEHGLNASHLLEILVEPSQNVLYTTNHKVSDK